MRRFMVGLLVWVALVSTAANAEDAPVSFKIAPPPVGYPILEAEARYVNTGADVVYATIDTNGAFTGGVQLNLPAGPFILSLFGVYHYTGGSYSTTQTSSMSYDYPSYTGSIENSAVLSLGCDLLYKPLNLALSSRMRSTEDYTLITVGLKWLFSRYGPL